MTRIIQALRDNVQTRPLSIVEALRLAEVQSLQLLKLSGTSDGPVPESIIADRQRLQVERVDLGEISGASQWAHGRWLILLNHHDAPTRQRFSLAHEFKHILDHPFVEDLYPDRYGMSRKELAEQVCDYFAGCLLMPRAWVREEWETGSRDHRALAARFDVSPLAMRVRLLQIGLIDQRKRCGNQEG